MKTRVSPRYFVNDCSFYELDKLLWLENFETLLSEVTTKWDGVIIITVDISMDLIGEQTGSSFIHLTLTSI